MHVGLDKMRVTGVGSLVGKSVVQSAGPSTAARWQGTVWGRLYLLAPGWTWMFLTVGGGWGRAGGGGGASDIIRSRGRYNNLRHCNP